MGSVVMSSGCSTVAVLENVVESEISLTASQSELHKASDAFCEASREAHWASGESSFAHLLKLWDGDVEVGQDYWETINKYEPTSVELVELISFDVSNAQSQLKMLNGLAQGMLPSHGGDRPRKADVNGFESVLIHASQARETFQAAFFRIQGDDNRLDGTAVKSILASFDAELQTARDIADGLAAARMMDALAEIEGQKSS